MQLRCDARLYKVDDQTFWEYTNVASQEFVSQEYETQDEAHLDMEEEGFLETTPKGRNENYTTQEHKFLCESWKKKIGIEPITSILRNQCLHIRIVLVCTSLLASN